MKTMKLAGQQIIRAALIATMLFGGLPSVGAQQENSAEGQKSAKAKAPGGQQEGIKVHGHWSIDIRNPNGSLASHFEFENALADNGSILAGLLDGFAVGKWKIALQGTAGASNSPCSGSSGCLVDATHSVIQSPTGQQIFQLQATVTANQAGRIEQVSTNWTGAVVTSASGTFTQKTLAAADQKAIVNGQIIQVTVGISFS